MIVRRVLDAEAVGCVSRFLIRGWDTTTVYYVVKQLEFGGSISESVEAALKSTDC